MQKPDPAAATAVVYERTGGPDVLQLVEKPLLAPGPGEVRVRVHRSGVNPTDWKARQGGADSRPVTPAQVPNQDGAGVVDAVGAGVEVALLGLRVWIWEAAYKRSEGTAQQFAIVPARQLVMLPDSASFDLGASLGIPFITAHRCLTVTEEGPRRLGPGTMAGRVVLVAGGAGAVGNAAIQLARWSDATVLATVSSPAKAQLAAAAGADHVINYRQQDVITEVGRISPRGVDTIVEVSAAANAEIDAAVVAPLGSVAIYANNGGDEFTLPIRPLMAPNARWQFVLVYTAPARAKGQAIDDISAAILDGAVAVGESVGAPLHHFSLADTAAAHQAVQDSVTGKVLIDVVESS
ncbi:NADPH:quinone reductase-like Zn-dependent oxidoreductase [Jatrophihabitans sp. GAS493]|uniref:NADPH:quinone reductase n=1 Tax=Jatrophihabitans sp. GAS493 TaxID=1907575 RepID=UPI000BB7D0B6|nr:NADPH:quinone reductase [Jatrophihabitans sp. GAS493]SOD74933.1 NADPH:quinone reductase-like Zn-dependent oxidoreductase [Jatrophihabitans sp. GAS493]